MQQWVQACFTLSRNAPNTPNIVEREMRRHVPTTRPPDRLKLLQRVWRDSLRGLRGGKLGLGSTRKFKAILVQYDSDGSADVRQLSSTGSAKYENSASKPGTRQTQRLWSSKTYNELISLIWFRMCDFVFTPVLLLLWSGSVCVLG